MPLGSGGAFALQAWQLTEDHAQIDVVMAVLWGVVFLSSAFVLIAERPDDDPPGPRD